MIPIGISSCLLGNPVRYDGGHKLDPFLKDTLGKYFRYVPVCPETECGLGVPREPMRLVGNPENPRLVTVKSGKDFTDQLTSWAKQRVKELEKEELCGFIFKKDSPSSGMERVKVYSESGKTAVKKGKGIFARIYQEHFPLHPVEEEGRLHDPVLREHFIERIFVFKRWRDFLSSKKTRGELVQFHTDHKLQIMAHSPEHYKKMGKLVAESKNYSEQHLFNHYQTLLLEAFSLKTTPKKHINTMQHMMGYFKKLLTSDEKKELIEIIDQYRNGYVPLIVPLTLFKHYIRKYDQPYLKTQHYIHPHPMELQLRTHVGRI